MAYPMLVEIGFRDITCGLACKLVEGGQIRVVTTCPSYRGEGRALYTCRERATPSLITYVVIVQLVKISIPYSVMYSSAYVRIPCTDSLCEYYCVSNR